MKTFTIMFLVLAIISAFQIPSNPLFGFMGLIFSASFIHSINRTA